MQPSRARHSARLGALALVWLVYAFSVGSWLDPSLPEPGIIGTAAAADGNPMGRASGSTLGSRAPSSGSIASNAITGPPVANADASHPRARPTAEPSPPAEPPACRFADETTQPGAGGDWVLAVVDTDFRLPPGYAPDDLVPVSLAGIPGGGLVRKIVLADLRTLAAAARAAGVPLTVYSAYRSEAFQAVVFDGWVRVSGAAAARRSSARSGHSEHQLGTTLDLGAGGAAPWTMDFAATRTGRWLAAHAVDFGFVVSYPKGASGATCYDAEPWHIRWVGRDRAAAVRTSGLTLREWLWRNPGG